MGRDTYHTALAPHEVRLMEWARIAEGILIAIVTSTIIGIVTATISLVWTVYRMKVSLKTLWSHVREKERKNGS